MRNISLFILYFTLSALTLQAAGFDTSLLSPKSATIETTQGNTLSFNAASFRVGQSGIVLKNIANSNVIIAQAVITKIEGGKAEAKFSDFELISQKYLPTPRAKPQAGDTLLFGSFYDKAIIIAPSQESYTQILTSIPRVDFMHIDLFGAFLAKDGINDPKEKHFREFCNAYSIGLVFLLASNGVNVLDCQSFEILQVLDFAKPELTQTSAPFFSRIVNINTGSLASKLRSKKSRNYFPYYDDLLEDSLKNFKSRTAQPN